MKIRSRVLIGGLIAATVAIKLYADGCGQVASSQYPTTCPAGANGCYYLTSNYAIWCAAVPGNPPIYDCEPEFLNGSYYYVNATVTVNNGGGCLVIGSNPTGSCINATNYYSTTYYRQVYGTTACKSGGA
jgi:hypothetical protein